METNDQPYSDTRSASVNLQFAKRGSQSSKSQANTSQITIGPLHYTQSKQFGGVSRYEELAKNSNVSIDKFYKTITKPSY